MQAEVSNTTKSIRKNAAKSLNVRFVAANKDWLNKYSIRVCKVAIEEDGMDLGQEVQQAVVSPHACRLASVLGDIHGILNMLVVHWQ
jgi:hypothetical protein